MTALNELRDRPLFICGHPKAGTSLVRAVLDSHPQLVVYPEETIFFRRYLPEAAGLDLPGKLALAEQRLIHIFTWDRAAPPDSQEGYPDRDYSAISFEEVRQAMRQIVTAAYRHDGDILSAAVLAFGQVSGQVGARYWVEKSPYNEYFSDQIFAWWPQARGLHIVRDPRDNYVSYRRKHPDWSAEFFANNWVRSTQAGLRNQERFDPQRYALIRYEDLAQSPEETLARLLEFLQIDWDASLTAPTRAGEQWIGNSMFANQFPGISAAPIGRWKGDLAPQDGAVIELIAAGLMDALGYERPLTAARVAKTSSAEASSVAETSSTPSRGLVRGARWRVATWPLRQRLARLRKLLQPAEPAS